MTSDIVDPFNTDFLSLRKSLAVKTIAIAATQTLASASTATFAQPTGFTGLYGQAGLGLGNSNTKSTFTEVEAGNVDSETQTYGTSNIAGNLALGYNHGFSNGFNLGANIFTMSAAMIRV